MSLKVIQVSKKYGDQLAVDNVSFEANKGTVLGFLGPNGAGKSTTMKMATGFVKPSSGEIIVAGHSITKNSFEARKQIGYLPEHNPLYLDFYVKEFLQFVGKIHEVPLLKSRIAEMIEMCGLQVEQHKKIGQLSKGYRQRVGLAQALIHDPEVLILDEPTTGLDPNQILEIRKLIKQISANKTVVFSTHIMQEVQALCDQVVIINKGKVVANDKLHNLTQGNTKAVLKIKFGSAIDKNLLLEIEGVNEVKVMREGEYDLHCSREVEVVRKTIFIKASEYGWDLLEIAKTENSLEEVFHQLTNQNG